MSRRDDIIQAALALVSEEGAEAVSVRNVAARAGIGASTLRYYFPKHRDLVNAVAGASATQTLEDLDIRNSNRPAKERLIECLMQFLPPDEGSLHLLEALVTAYASCFVDGKLIGSPMFEVVGKVSREKIVEWLQTLENEGQSLRLPAQDLARVLLAHLNGVAIDLIIDAPSFTLGDASAEVRKMASLALQNT